MEFFMDAHKYADTPCGIMHFAKTSKGQCQVGAFKDPSVLLDCPRETTGWLYVCLDRRRLRYMRWLGPSGVFFLEQEKQKTSDQSGPNGNASVVP